MKMMIMLMAIFSVHAFADETSQEKLSQDARQRILAKVIAAVEAETQAKCTELEQRRSISVANVDVMSTSVAECNSVKVKIQENGARDSLGRIKIDF